MVRDVAKHPCRGRHHARLQIVAAGQPRDGADFYTCTRVRVRIIANELIKNVGNYQSRMVSKLRIIFKRIVVDDSQLCTATSEASVCVPTV